MALNCTNLGRQNGSFKSIFPTEWTIQIQELLKQFIEGAPALQPPTKEMGRKVPTEVTSEPI